MEGFCHGSILYLSFAGCLLIIHAQIEDVAKGRGAYATQLGVYNLYTADKALDGDTNPDDRAGHCAHSHGDSGSGDKAWWMVDLGSSHAIYNVTIYSEDSTSNGVVLGYISVRVSDRADINEHTDQCAFWDKRTFPRKSHQTLVCDQVMYGRYVSIQRNGGDRTYAMILCEVMVMGKRMYDTNCANCNDDPCEQKAPCSKCLAYTEPECREVCDANKYGINCQHQCSGHCQGDECDSETGHCECDPGYYGDKCEEQCNRHCKNDICGKDTGHCECESGHYGDDCDRCSEGCEDTCNSDSGTCSCKDWWDGNKCDTEVGIHKIQRFEVTFTDITDSSVVVTWRTIRDLPDNMKQYYSYGLEYRVDGKSEWTVVSTFQHEPDADGTQQYTLTGLQYNTVYEVHVWSVRSLGGLTERTEDALDAEFTTKCKAPGELIDMQITHEQDNKKVDLVITWKAPDPRCDRIKDNHIEYRLSSVSEDDWTKKDLSSRATSARISDLDPGKYVVRLTITNNEDLTSSDRKTYTALLVYDTNCDKCDDTVCLRTASCQTCKIGHKLPECRICESGHYGVNCAEDCSEGCKDTTCDHVLGTCSCGPWWTGDKCSTEIKAKTIPREDPAATSLTDSSAVIKWKKITNVPAGISNHYQYVIEYMEETSNSWVEWQTRYSHDPSSDQYQEATLNGLKYNTAYDVRVKAYRVQNGVTEETGATGEMRLQTDCEAPSEPQNILAAFVSHGGRTILMITWEHPKEVGCNKVVKYVIHYRLKSALDDDWTKVAEKPASSTSLTVELDPADYVVKVEVTNDGGYSNSNYTDASHTLSESTGSGDGSSFPSSAVGIIICCLLVIIGLIAAVIYLLRRGKKPEPHTQTTQKDIVYEEVEERVAAQEPDVRVEDTSENPYEKPALNHYVNEEVKPEYTDLRRT